GCEGARAPPRARLRDRGGRPRAREGRVPPPPRPELPGARGGSHTGRDPRPRARRGAAARGGARSFAVLGMRHARLLGDVTPERPGPGPLPPELLRALQIEVSRRLESALAGDF